MEKQSRLMMWMVVLVPVLAAVLAILPPEQKLKAGIDLAGGFSLLYEIDTTGLSASDIRARGGLANRVIEVLRKRVDPNAQMNLIWRAVGNTRLEIQMPRPPGRAAERRRQKDAAFNAIQERNIGRVEIEMALGAPPAERQERLDQLIRDVPERQPLLATLAQAYDAYRQAQESDDLDAEDRAQAAYEQAFDAVLKTSLSPDRVADVLGLLPGKERTEQLGALKNEHPSYARLIEDAEAKYAEWAQDKSFLEDPSDLKRLLRGAGVLEFRILADRDPENPSRTRADDPSLRQSITDYLQQLQQFGPRPKAGDRYRWFEIDNIKSFLYLDSMDQLENYTQTGQQVVAKYAGKWYVLAHDDPTYGLIKSSKNRWKLKSALPTRDENGRPAVSFRLDPRGGSQFRTMTGHNIERQMAIMLDDVAMSQAVIKSRIGERGQISGSTFTPEKVRNLVQTLEAGSLPGRLKETPLMEKNVGPSLGLANREMGLKAAVYGLIVVAAFILIYYMFAGMVANVALFLNLLFVLGIMAMMEATFTLPGIAGLILTVGMAVDANVLIFERIREEREKGSVLKRAIKTGYEKALSTIVDANLTTLITCVVLGYLGSEEVKGFAMTLGFGIVTSMFTALFVTRLIFLTLMDRGWLNDLKMFK
ncbi:MAG: protein translocase subunit SecD, partial [Phycisphaerae bacterium]